MTNAIQSSMVKVAGVVAGIALVAMSFATAQAAFTRDLTIGSTGADVSELQTWLISKGHSIPAGATGYFGAQTQAALAAWQAANGVTPAAGYFGPITRAKVAMGGSSSNSGSSSNLEGGAGSITVNDSNEYNGEEVLEGEEEVGVLRFSVEADDNSDVMVTSIKVEFVNVAPATPDSPDFDDYADSVQVMFGGEVVGEADVDEFTENNDVWTKTIALDGVMIEADQEEDIDISVTALDVIDSDDYNNDNWSVDVLNVRFEDADGAIISEETDGDSLEQSFDFDDAGADEALNLKSSSNDPDASTLLVDDQDNSDEHHVFTFKIEAEENDINLENLVLNVYTPGDVYEDVVSDVRIEIDGEEADDFDVTNGNTATATLAFDLDSDYTVDADDTIEVKVYMEFLETTGNYVSGQTVQVATVSVDGEGADDVSDAAVVSGEEHTLSESVAALSNIKWEVGTAGTLIDLLFTVEAEEDDVDVLIGDITAVDTIAGTATVGTPTVTKVSGDASGVVDAYTVNEGDTATFRVRYAISGTNGQFANVTIPALVGTALADEKELSPTATLNVN